jgi:N-formylglutamate deformylase
MTVNAAAIAPKGADVDDWAGDPAMHALAAEPIQIFAPERQRAPFIFASPHSGRFYPPSFSRATRLDPVTLRKSRMPSSMNSSAASRDWAFRSSPPHAFRALLSTSIARLRELDPAMFDAPVDSRVGPRIRPGWPQRPWRYSSCGPRWRRIYGARLPARAAFRLERFYRPYHTTMTKLALRI